MGWVRDEMCEQKVKAMYIDQESIHIITWAGKTTRKGF